MKEVFDNCWASQLVRKWTKFIQSLYCISWTKKTLFFFFYELFNNEPHWNFGGHVYGWWLVVDLFFISLFWKCGKVQFSIQNIFSRPFYLVFYVMVIWNNPRLLSAHTQILVISSFQKINQIPLIINSLNNSKQLNAE